MSKIKGGVTMSITLGDAATAVVPGDLLIESSGTYLLLTDDVDADNVGKVVIALDYDESGDGVIAAIPLVSGCRMYEIPTAEITATMAIGNPLSIIAGLWKVAIAGGYVCARALSTKSISTEGAGYVIPAT